MIEDSACDAGRHGIVVTNKGQPRAAFGGGGLEALSPLSEWEEAGAGAGPGQESVPLLLGPAVGG